MNSESCWVYQIRSLWYERHCGVQVLIYREGVLQISTVRYAEGPSGETIVCHGVRCSTAKCSQGALIDFSPVSWAVPMQEVSASICRRRACIGVEF